MREIGSSLFLLAKLSLSPPGCSEEAGPEWHHLLLRLQPLHVRVRLRLVLPLCRPLLLPRRHPAGPVAHPPPRRPHPPALLPRRQLPVHRRAQGEAWGWRRPAVCSSWVCVASRRVPGYISQDCNKKKNNILIGWVDIRLRQYFVSKGKNFIFCCPYIENPMSKYLQCFSL